MSIKTPAWTSQLWNSIKDRSLTSKGGFNFPEQREVAFLIVNGDLWSDIFEPAPDPDPPNDAYPMSQDNWNRISGGELLANNCIRKQGQDWKVQAVSDRTKYCQVVACSG